MFDFYSQFFFFSSQAIYKNLDENQNLDYISCLGHDDFNPIVVNESAITCNLEQRQRSSQQILDLADYLEMHYFSSLIRRYDAPSSFLSDIPTWIELSNPRSFFDYFKDQFDSPEDVMLIHNKPSNLNDIEHFCQMYKWRCTSDKNVKGTDASVTILYDLDDVYYESLTRANFQLVIVTVEGEQRYFFISKLFSFLR